MLLRKMLPLIIVGLLATPAFASDPAGPAKSTSDDPPAQTLASETLAPVRLEVVHMPADFKAPSRGPALPVLYGSLAALQAYDAVATLRGVNAGRVEINPMMAGVSGTPAAMWAVKASVTTAAIVASERLWRTHRRSQAIVVMAIANGVMAGVALHNASATAR
jgi:hypothetical protein